MPEYKTKTTVNLRLRRIWFICF